MKLLNLAWDLLGSDFAGRHMQYEKFYAGPGFVMNSYSHGAAPWAEWAGAVDELLASIDTPGACRKNNRAIRDVMTPGGPRSGDWSGSRPYAMLLRIAAGHDQIAQVGARFGSRKADGIHDTKYAASTLGGAGRRGDGALLAPAPAQAGKSIVMKLSTATINDTQHEWFKRFAAAGRKGFRRQHQGRDLSGKPTRLDSATDRGRAVRLDPGLDGAARIPGWGR